MNTETITIDIDRDLAEQLRAAGKDPASLARAALEAEASRANAKETALSEWRAMHRAELEAMDAEFQHRETFGGETRAW
jgi:post-segregation antitoxin (ccd killing protein)